MAQQQREVDELVLGGLRSLGCTSIADAKIKTVAELTQDHVYEAVARSLRLLAKRQYSLEMPRNLAGQVARCTQMVNVIKELGYKHELSYHMILYPNPADTRALLAWLVETIPKDSDRAGAADSPLARLQPALALVRAHLDRQRDCRRQRRRHMDAVLQARRAGRPAPSMPDDVAAVPWQRQAPVYSLRTDRVELRPPAAGGGEGGWWVVVTAQVRRRQDAAASVLVESDRLRVQGERQRRQDERALADGVAPDAWRERQRGRLAGRFGAAVRAAVAQGHRQGRPEWATRREQDAEGRAGSGDAAGLGGGSLFSRLLDFAVEQERDSERRTQTAEELREKREAELHGLEEACGQMQRDIDRMRRETQRYAALERQLAGLLQEELKKGAEAEREFRLKKVVFDMLDDAEANIAKLQKAARADAARQLELAAAWEKHRVPLVEELRRLRGERDQLQEQANRKLERVQRMRDEQKSLQQQTAENQSRLGQLTEQYAAMPKNVQRAQYTARILELVKQVKKQRVDIDRVLVDTRSLQKEINTVSETLQRTFLVVTEKIFADAKTDPAAKEAYRKIAELDKMFKSLQQDAEDIGQQQNSVLDLERAIDAIEQRTSSLNAERLSKDLKKIERENIKLEQRLG